jgi:energy-coupling factor transport system substrate-specific component
VNRRVRAGVAGALAVGAIVLGTWQGWPWYLSTVAALALAGYAALEVYESLAVDAKYLAFVASLSAIAAISRTAMQGIPGVQPATFFVLMTGFCFGPMTGLSVGAFTAVASNLFLGEGGWTPWQMLAWGLVGCSAGWLRRLVPGLSVRWLIPFGFMWGYLFGWIMNTWSFLGNGVFHVGTFLALCVSSVWFDTMHAFATAAFLAIGGRGVYDILERFRRKMNVSRLN